MKEWPFDQYGKFYNGDSYIVLNVRLHSVLLLLCSNSRIYVTDSMIPVSDICDTFLCCIVL